MNGRTTTNALKEVSGVSVGMAIVMIVLGVVAFLMPFWTGIAVSIFVGWIIVFGGLAYLAYAFAAPRAGVFLWRILIGVLYVAGGGYLAFHPRIALESLTLMMAAIFLVEGVSEIAVYFQTRKFSGSGWVLFDGIVTILLAYLIWRPWPSSSIWVIGTLLGINLVISGTTRLMYSVAVRNVLKAAT